MVHRLLRVLVSVEACVLCRVVVMALSFLLFWYPNETDLLSLGDIQKKRKRERERERERERKHRREARMLIRYLAPV